MDLEKLEEEYRRTRYIKIFRQYGILVAMGLVGLAIAMYGFWLAVVPEPPKVEILRSAQDSEEGGRQAIFVDVAGAVEKPGVYSLPTGSRLGDVLLAAGGLSAGADREWVARALNLAEPVKDGEKIYIPANQPAGEPDGRIAGESVSRKERKVNINTASQAELEALSGIGEARAKAIIEKRPYGSAAELVSKAKIPESVYEKLKEQVTVY